MFISGTPGYVTGAGGTFPATLNATPSLANGNGVVPTQGGSVLSATNGGYSNLLQGNAALSATNGLYADLLQGNAVLSATNPIFAQLTTATTVIGQADNAAWTEGTTPQINLGCEYTSGGATALTTGHAGTPGCTSARAQLTDKSSVAGTALVAAVSAYGTPPTGTDVEGVNAYVTASALPTGAATSANQTVTQGVIGNATAPADMSVGGLVYNSSALTLTNGQSSALQGDANGYLEVDVKAGGGSGGTSSSFSATFPSTGTAAGAEYLSSAPTLTSGQMVALQVTSAGSLHATVDNSNANGQATMANSSPVVIASNQSAVPVSVASGGIASGALASGSIASGAAVSGAFVAGAIADLAHGQGTMAASVPVAIASNQSNVPTNQAQIGGSAYALGSTTASASAPVVLASNQTAADPCMFQAKTNLPISTNSTSLAQIIAASASTKIYICSIALVGAGATAFNLDTGTGTNCGSSTAAVIGSTTAANGMSLAANGGLTLGNGGSTVAVANVAGAELCTLQSNAVQVAGNLTYVQQ